MTLHEEWAREVFHGHQENSLPAWAARRAVERISAERTSRHHRSAKSSSRIESVRGEKAIGCIA